jgi:hypothetical protein
MAAIYGTYYNYNPSQWAALLRRQCGSRDTGPATTLFLCINLIVSMIVQFVQGKGTSGDLVKKKPVFLRSPVASLKSLRHF